MNVSKRIRFWIPLCMILSVVLLGFFISHWIYTQHRYAAKELDKTIQHDLDESNRQVIDSMLLNFIPVQNWKQQLKDSMHNVQLSKKLPGEPKSGVVIINTIDSIPNFSFEKKIEITHTDKTIKKQMSETGKPQILILDETKRQIPKDSLMVKLFVEGVGTLAEKISAERANLDVLTFTNQSLDSNLFKKILAQNWSSKGLNYRCDFHPDKAIGLKKIQELYYPGNPLLKHSIALSLTDKNTYLWKSLLPELSFSFILLLIVSLAFWLTYKSLRKQVELNALRIEFMNNITHELKTPVSTLKVALEALNHYQRKNEPEVMEDYLQMIGSETDRLDRLVHLVLDYSQLDREALPIRREWSEPAVLIRQVIQDLKLKYHERVVRFDFQCSDETIKAYLDPLYLQGVLLNLLENSIKYGSEENASVSIHLEQQKQEIRILVADNGPGIPAPYRKQIFEAFFRVPQGNVHDVKGYGLGLSFCARVMKLHGGSIRLLDSEQGAVFELSFPNHPA